jgi:hypothetical protein
MNARMRRNLRIESDVFDSIFKWLNIGMLTIVGIIALLVLANIAKAGDNNGPKTTANATALGIGAAVAAGGAASAATGDSLYLALPGGSAPGLSNVWGCAVSNSWQFAGLFGKGTTTNDPFCQLLMHKREVCSDFRNAKRGSAFEASLQTRCVELIRELMAFGKAKAPPPIIGRVAFGDAE